MGSLNYNNYRILEIKVIIRSYARSYSGTMIDCQHLLVGKWGVPFDIEFQRGKGLDSVYCTVFPVAFGLIRCRHESELDYLMHLQDVVEVLKNATARIFSSSLYRKQIKSPSEGLNRHRT